MLDKVPRASGAYRIATHLRRQGYHVEVIDFLLFWTIEELVEIFKSRNSKNEVKWIGISTTFIYEQPIIKELISRLKQIKPDLVIVAGGNNNNFTEDLGIDFYISGFGEYAIDAVLDYKFNNKRKPYGKPKFKGWIIDALVFYPAWPMSDYTVVYHENDFITPEDVLTIELSRGCRFKCKFCDFPVLGIKEDTSVSEDVLYKELTDNYEKWGVTNYNIADETANDRSSKLEKLANVVTKSNIQLNFNAFVRIDLLKSHPEQLELMCKARLWGHYYGVETFNHRTGKIIGKGMDPDTVKELMLSTKNHFKSTLGLYRGTASVIAGLPYESFDSLRSTANWLKENWNTENWNWFPLTIPKKDNIRLSAFGEDFSKFGYSGMTEEEVQKYISNASTNQDYNANPRSPMVYWKNDEGTFFDFQKLILEEFDSNLTHKLGNWALFGALSTGIDVKDIIDLGMHEKFKFNFEEAAMKKVSSYKLKKLSM